MLLSNLFMEKQFSLSAVLFGFAFYLFLPNLVTDFSNRNLFEKEKLTIEFDTTLNSFLIHPPYVSGVINDSKDPSFKFGIFFKVLNFDAKKKFEIKAISDNQQVVKDENIIIESLNTTFKIKIKPSNVGYANLLITCKNGDEEASITINYAASAFEQESGVSTYWHTGITDASAALAIDNNYMLVADDEKNKLLLYFRNLSGLPIKEFDYSADLNLSDGNQDNFKEVDCEAGVASLKKSGRAYWLGSMSNSETSFKQEPNRNRLFATEMSGVGKDFSIRTLDYTDGLRKAIINYGDAKGFKLSKCGSFGHSSKVDDGFNIEGMCFAPDSCTLYICFRAPILPDSNKSKSLIIPVLNFEKWVDEGHKISKIPFDEPILVDLGERGIRDIIAVSDGTYAIIAGKADDKSNFSIYSWSGKREDAPQETKMFIPKDSKPEALLEFIDGSGNHFLQVLSDNGSTPFFNDGVKGKYLIPEFKKFRDDYLQLN